MRQIFVILFLTAAVSPAIAQTPAVVEGPSKTESLATVNLAEVGLAGSLTAGRVTIDPGIKRPDHTHMGAHVAPGGHPGDLDRSARRGHARVPPGRRRGSLRRGDPSRRESRHRAARLRGDQRHGEQEVDAASRNRRSGRHAGRHRGRRAGAAARAGPRDHSGDRRPVSGAQRQLVHDLSRHPRRHHPRRSDQSGLRHLVEGGVEQPVQGAGALCGLQSQPLRPRRRGRRLCRHRQVRRAREHAAEPRRPLSAHAGRHGRSQSQRRHRSRRDRHPHERGAGHLRHGPRILRDDRPRQERAGAAVGAAGRHPPAGHRLFGTDAPHARRAHGGADCIPA